MRADYKNWVPQGLVIAFGAGSLIFLALLLWLLIGGGILPPVWRWLVTALVAVALVGCAGFTVWCLRARAAFDYAGERQLSRHIVDGIADRIALEPGDVCLDVGCGSGALAIAVAQRNPDARVVGLDRWGPEYRSYNRELCERNARAEGVANVSFVAGDARHLDFPDGTFDAIVSNYVYHNIAGADKQALLKESLRVLKKGGRFAIHDIMSRQRFGDMEAFVAELRDAGYAEVRLIPTTDGLFMTEREAGSLFLKGSALLCGRK